MYDVTINESEYDLENGEKGKLAVFLYGGSGDPFVNLNMAISSYVGDNSYYEFIDANMDNPWMRVIISDINNMKQYDFNIFIEKRIRLKKLKELENVKNLHNK